MHVPSHHNLLALIDNQKLVTVVASDTVFHEQVVGIYRFVCARVGRTHSVCVCVCVNQIIRWLGDLDARRSLKPPKRRES